MRFGVSQIETSLFAGSRRVDPSRGLGTVPPSSSPTGEQSAAKPNLGLAAFGKPWEGGTEEKRERDTFITLIMVVTGWSACVLWLCCCLGIEKNGI